MRSELFSTPTFQHSHSTAIIFAMKHSYIYGLLGLGLLCQLCGLAKAQQLPPAAPIPYYRDTITGRLYWNKNIPLYVSLSPNADGSGGTVLQSHKTPQWGFPFYLDTEGVNYIRTRWAVDTATRRAVQPPTEILWEVYADGRPPESRIAVLPHVVLKDGRIAVNAEATATLTSRDAVSGVGATYYSLNGAVLRPLCRAAGGRMHHNLFRRGPCGQQGVATHLPAAGRPQRTHYRVRSAGDGAHG